LRLVPGGSLEGCREGDLREALRQLITPITLVFEPEEARNCGDDHVVAVNLTRQIPEAHNPIIVRQAMNKVTSRYPGAANVILQHFHGGPCEDDGMMCCIVLGGSGCGWTVKRSLEEAIELAHSRAAKRSEAQGDFAGGQMVRLTGLKAAPELNGEVGLTLRFAQASGRWLVKLRNGEGKQLKNVNLEALEGAEGRVLVFWGDARWSRAQLLGEIARGHWGLCRAGVSEFTCGPSERRANLRDRLVFAPVTEMTEGFMQEGRRQMVAARAAMQMQAVGADEEPEGDE